MADTPDVPVNVLVVFYSRYGAAERLALAAGLGAIQEGANIRLRRLADLAPPASIAGDKAWTDSLARMQRDYVTPRPADPVWADLIVLASPQSSDGELEHYVASLPSCGSMAGKVAGPITVADPGTLANVYGAAACAGLLVAPVGASSGDPVASALAHGRSLVRAARALKAAPAD